MLAVITGEDCLLGMERRPEVDVVFAEILVCEEARSIPCRCEGVCGHGRVKKGGTKTSGENDASAYRK